MDNTLLELLRRSYDATLSPGEIERLDKALEADIELQQEKKHLDKLRGLLEDERYAFDDHFADRVMERIATDEKNPSENPFLYAFKRIALPGLVAAVILFLFTVFSSGTLSLDSILGVDAVQPEYVSEFLLFNY
jgi:hypothetical protein